MAIFYFDTSAIVKRYHKELGSEVIDKIFEERSKGHGFATSYWTILEFTVAFSAKRKRKEISEEAFNVATSRFLNDVLELFAIKPVNDEAVSSAISIAAKHSLPSADCLQIASVVDLKNIMQEAKQKVVLISSDQDMCKTVEKEKLDFINPEEKDTLAKLDKLVS